MEYSEVIVERLTYLSDHSKLQYLCIIYFFRSTPASASVIAKKTTPLYTFTIGMHQSPITDTQTYFSRDRITDCIQRSHAPSSSPLTHIRSLYYCVINGMITNLPHRARRPFAAVKITSKIFFESA